MVWRSGFDFVRFGTFNRSCVFPTTFITQRQAFSSIRLVFCSLPSVSHIPSHPPQPSPSTMISSLTTAEAARRTTIDSPIHTICGLHASRRRHAHIPHPASILHPGREPRSAFSLIIITPRLLARPCMVRCPISWVCERQSRAWVPAAPITCAERDERPSQ